MMDQQTQAIISALIEKTEQKQAIWNAGNLNCEYQLVLEKALITIALKFDSNLDNMYEFTIYNENGSIVEMYNQSYGQDYYGLLGALYQVVDRTVLKKDITKQSILDQLKGSGVLGKEDDSIPF